MILEGIVTTLAGDGAVNIAPMGPRLGPPFVLEPGTAFDLKPFATARTWANLKDHPEGVLHVHDDVLLLARAALGPSSRRPRCSRPCGFAARSLPNPVGPPSSASSRSMTAARA
jgi:hypothetical protein